MQTIMDVVTFFLASVGAVLGIISTWAGLIRDRPRLKVRPVQFVERLDSEGTLREVISQRFHELEEGVPVRWGIKLINTGYVAVHISEVGVCALWTARFQRRRKFVHPADRLAFDEDPTGHIVFPRELAPGTSITVTAPGVAMGHKRMRTARSVYVITQGEWIEIGKGEVLDGLKRKALRDAKRKR